MLELLVALKFDLLLNHFDLLLFDLFIVTLALCILPCYSNEVKLAIDCVC